LLQRRPAALSGGERQRVALGRALIRQPRVFLMDEPLSNLDAALRVQMRAELSRLHNRIGVTTVYVTHDQVEAMTMGDRIAVMCDGRLQQVDTPEQLYEAPANVFVAGFIGSPKMNLLPGRLVNDADQLTVEFLGARVPLPHAIRMVGPDNGDIVSGVRPEDVVWTADATSAHSLQLHGVVDVIEPIGAATYVTVRVADATLVCRFRPRAGLHPGDAVDVALDPTRLHLFDARTQLRVWMPQKFEKGGMTAIRL
jgi:multiple sugar transport system ATP-binding protein